MKTASAPTCGAAAALHRRRVAAAAASCASGGARATLRAACVVPLARRRSRAVQRTRAVLSEAPPAPRTDAELQRALAAQMASMGLTVETGDDLKSTPKQKCGPMAAAPRCFCTAYFSRVRCHAHAARRRRRRD
jgi:hypothetical protein